MTEEFPLAPDLCHLNHAAVGPWPRRTAEVVAQFARENSRQGSLGYPQWLGVEQRLRERLARLIAADSADDIALAKNTSEALSIIAQGLTWEPGDNIIGIRQEFPSNRIVWESLADRGVEWRALDLEASTDPEGDLIARCDARTRMIAISWVQYASGLRLDLKRIGAFCQDKGVLFCVDAIQGLGALPFDLASTQADFVVADGHKWMLGPEGVALLYVRPELRDQLSLHQFGWHMVEHCGDFDRTDWAPAASARRFECGSPNLLGVHALEASLSLLEEVGMDQVRERLQARVDHLIRLIDARGFDLLTPRELERRAGILTFRVPGVASDHLYAELMARRVLCAHRGGGIRFSPHFYTPMEVLDRAMGVVDAVIHG
ncbi:aminotransferase class V-fold PLP-dependent enzyme [Thiorhodococcus mannitoliphagus]|uniref:Aminotransferase class V-fold PLP-dependent enzyme n=1 Tax=Thiorhodococcus mannitoliphagus TaxID=329406 RepID=A0A6P1DTW9_9GAMM|nr:aminotransferase class V-fold PLP-dependent enzyme [Thiorhodococcus mannitoliphagus]NEX21767.1 aminotransferase class V-fold PLP-dependent enzyme [Thiorhodococcus mannitoliphagus]